MIAVLPFENLGRPEDAYFASGLTEEITSRLTGIEGLGVISRASVGEYRDSDRPLRQVAQELGVDYLLQGSVRWDTHRRDREGTGHPQPDPGAATSAVSGPSDTTPGSPTCSRCRPRSPEGVARALNVAIGIPERQALARRPTENADAYAYYLRGTDYLVGSWGEVRRLRIARDMFARATALDAGFALAFARLSQAHSALYASTTDGTDEDSTRARSAAETAIRLRPDLRRGARGDGVLPEPVPQGVRRGALRELRDRRPLAAEQRRSGGGARAGPPAARPDGARRWSSWSAPRRLNPRSAELASDIGDHRLVPPPLCRLRELFRSGAGPGARLGGRPGPRKSGFR